MTDLILVTSKDIDSQLGTVQDKVYIGLWCLEDLEQINHKKLLPLPWADEEIKRKDFDHIQNLYKSLLPYLVDYLNEIHSKNHSEDFWELVLGAWLQQAISVFYQRIDLIDKVFEQYELTSVGIFKDDYWFEPAIDYNDFTSFCQNSEWNDYVFSKIIRMKKPPLKFIEVENKLDKSKLHYSIKLKLINFTKSLIGITISNINSYIKPSIFFHNSYFSRENEGKLSKALGQIPQIMSITLLPPNIKAKPLLRNNVKLKEKTIQENIIFSLLIDQIPKVYLESFQYVEKSALRFYPSRVKAIFTGVSDICDDHFKIWAAHQKTKNVPLLISQHGGCYGLSELTQAEVIQRKYASKFYTWGWEGNGSENLFPMSAPKLIPKSIVNGIKKRNKILVTLYDIPMYTYWNQSFPVGEKMLDYMDSIDRFIKHSSEEVTSNLVMRFYPHDFGWNFNKRLKRLLEDYNFDDTQSLIKSMEESKLCVTTCNSTTFLEFIVSGIPTIAFWEEELFPLRENAKGKFSELKKVGVFHETAIEAAKFISSISNDIDGWWSNSEVQKAREDFCLTYARTSTNWLAEWKDELEKIEANNK